MPRSVNDLLVVGRINGLFGTRGWLKVFSYTRPRDNLLVYPRWQVRTPDGGWREHVVVEARRHHGGLIAALDGIADRDQAAALLRADIAIARTELAAPGPDEYYWAELIGMQVVDRDQRELGVVVGLLETGAHDVLRVRGEREYLIPFVREVYVLRIERAERLIVVDWHRDD